MGGARIPGNGFNGRTWLSTARTSAQVAAGPGAPVLSGVARRDAVSGRAGLLLERGLCSSVRGSSESSRGGAGRGGAGRARARALSLQHQEVGGPAGQQERPDEHRVAEEHEGEQLPQQLQHVDGGRGRHRPAEIRSLSTRRVHAMNSTLPGPRKPKVLFSTLKA